MCHPWLRRSRWILWRCLARAGHEVFFIARGAHLDAIQKQGLSIKSAKGDFRIETPKSGERCDPNFDPDLVIVAVKSWQLPEITEEIKNYCTPSTLFFPFRMAQMLRTSSPIPLDPKGSLED